MTRLIPLLTSLPNRPTSLRVRAQSFGRVERAAGDTPFERAAIADDLRHEGKARIVGHDPPANEHPAEARAARSDSYIAASRNAQSRSDRGSVHRCNRRLGQRTQ